MDLFWVRHWWLIFPVMWFAFAALRMWSFHRRSTQTFELLRRYAEQGKEPPAELMRTLHAGPRGLWRPMRRGAYWEWRRTIFLASLSAGFGVAAFLDNGDRPDHAFMVVAVVTGALALGSLVFSLLHSKFDDK